LGVASGWALIAAKSKPYFVFGWFYFIGTLVPVIGIIQVGTQSMADRYTYIPSIGLFVVMVWTVADLLKKQPNQVFIGAVAGTASLSLACLLTSVQVTYWRNSQVLFQHALAVTRNNYLAEDWLGETLRDTGQTEPALDLFEQSVANEPHYAPAQADLAQELLAAGRPAESLAHLQMAAALAPNDAAVQQNWGAVLATHGETKEGILHLESALRLQPHSVRTLNQLAWIYATSADVQNRNGTRSVQLAEEACAATQNGNALYLQTLSAAYAEAGNFSQAAHWLEQARMLATAHQQRNILNKLDVIEKVISAQQPYRDPALQ
jgi:tetratricopeptide (TPR) repeat protein